MNFWELWFLQSLALSSLIFPFLRKRILAQMNPEDLLLQTFLLLLIFQFSVGQKWYGWRCHHHQEQVNPRRASVPPSGLYASLWMAMPVSGPLEGLLSGGVCIPPQRLDVGHPIHCLPPCQPQLPPRTQPPAPSSQQAQSLPADTSAMSHLWPLCIP